jgi:hypothetical protein
MTMAASNSRDKLLEQLDRLLLQDLIARFDDRKPGDEPVPANVLAVVVKFLKDNDADGRAPDDPQIETLSQRLEQYQRDLDNGAYDA